MGCEDFHLKENETTGCVGEGWQRVRAAGGRRARTGTVDQGLMQTEAPCGASSSQGDGRAQGLQELRQQE